MVIINQALAKQFWPDRDPLNGSDHHRAMNPPRQIIGVVGDVRDDALNRDPRPNLYVPSSDRETGISQIIAVGLGDPDPGGAAVVEFRDSE